ncbi:unnamed protein product [Brassicogethes aeneus]|uniref:ENTH domain-containing protein n=1 Tax=Brassicogethes aeneus TaxID=1431903 RepID=A0A9P0FFN0_BRAAE|nr:unnamed protein product [Brassicogethes aeneus]
MEQIFSMWKMREIADKVTNVVMNYTEIEAKVREATNDEAWGPTGQIMQELAHSTFTYEHFPEVMSMLWKRMLQDNKQHWRRTYKSLLVLNYLIKNGSERVVTSAREHIYDLRSLENYSYTDEVGKDQGVNIRHKVKELIDFIQDDDRLREERKKAKKNKDKYIGMSSDMMGMRSGGHGGGWDDRPPMSNRDRGDRDYADQHDWDDSNNSNNSNNANQYRDRSFDEDYEYEKGESDTDSKSNYSTTQSHIKTDFPQEKRVNINLNTSINTSPKKQGKPLKKVDLGAAANFGRMSTQSPVQQSNLLNDDFDPRAGEAPRKSNEFGDFENAFKEPPTKSDDDFADFSSAFAQSNHATVSAPPQAPQAPSDDLLGLGGLASLGIQPQQQQPTFGGSALNNNQGLLNQAPATDLLDGFSGSVLSPLSMLQPMSSTPNNNTERTSVSKPVPVGSTWTNSGNLNIDLDNLLVSKPKTGPSPSMNQLASNPTSPVNQARPMATQTFPQQQNFFADFK